MPTLKDLVCHVQWADTGSPFPEHGTLYGDGVVETYIAIPTHPQAFTIRLTSRKFIFQGLAMVVFIDGNYQCNRNRVNLLPPKKNRPRDRTEVDFLVRQKEKPMGDGTYMGREWRFDDYNIGPFILLLYSKPIFRWLTVLNSASTPTGCGPKPLQRARNNRGPSFAMP